MAWSWKIGRIAGIPVYVHWTFLILLGYFFSAGVLNGEGIAQVLEEIAFILALFGCVVLHETGHALTARRFGIATTDITLLPIGGVARLQRIPEKPSQELLVALAGPAVNVAIVAVLLSIGVRAPSEARLARTLLEGGFWARLLEVNFFLFAFNLLPAFPMDGGRVLRALLAMRMEYARATRLAASVGQLMAIGFGMIGLTSHLPMLLLIALFVWIGAEGEAVQVEERLALRGSRVRDAMVTDFHTLAAEDSLGHAAELLLAGSQHDFPVLSDAHATGVLTRSNLLAALARKGCDALVGGFAQAELPPVEPASALVPAINRLREGGLPCLRVVENGRTVGLLTLENVGEFLMVRAALSSAAAVPGGVGLARPDEATLETPLGPSVIV